MNYESKEPNGRLGIIALESCHELGEKIDYYLCSKRNNKLKKVSYEKGFTKSVLIDITEARFSNGEGKIVINESIRGKDVFILCDVGNYSCTYDMFGHTNRMGPDEHFQDIKRVVSALNGRAKKVTVLMPLLYASRQHRRKYRESLDCAMALQELQQLGVTNILTFDVHDPNVQNAIPLMSFNNIYPTFNIVKEMLTGNQDIKVDKNELLIISPDTGAMDRSIYYSNVLGVDVGLFYKRRDYSKVVKGTNPIVMHEYMGRDVEGFDCLIVDDMIASGGSVFDIAIELKKRKAKNIYVATTFALFTSGLSKFEEYYKQGVIKQVFSTNLTYLPEEVKTAEWFSEVDMAEYIADIIDHINLDTSIETIIDDEKNIKELMNRL